MGDTITSRGAVLPLNFRDEYDVTRSCKPFSKPANPFSPSNEALMPKHRKITSAFCSRRCFSVSPKFSGRGCCVGVSALQARLRTVNCSSGNRDCSMASK